MNKMARPMLSAIKKEIKFVQIWSHVFSMIVLWLGITMVLLQPSPADAWPGEPAAATAPNTNQPNYLVPNSSVNQTILGALASNPGNYSIFVSLCRQVGLLGVLANRTGNSRTVFAPNNSAFEPYLEFEKFFLESHSGRQLLQSILLYHILPSRSVVVANVNANTTLILPSLLGPKIEPTIQNINGTKPYVDYAPILVPDVKTWNGIIQGINIVLLPVPFAIISGADAREVHARPTNIYSFATSITVPSFTVPTISPAGTPYPVYPTNTVPYH